MPAINHVSLSDRHLSPPQLPQSYWLKYGTIITGEDQIFFKGAIKIESNKVCKIMNVDEMTEQESKEPYFDASDYLIIPGLINSHSHVAMSFFRGLAHNQQSMIETLFFPCESKLTPELLEPLAYSDLIGGLKSGVTCFFDHYYHVNGIGRAMEAIGIRGALGEVIADLGSALPQDSMGRAERLLAKWPFSDLITPVVAPHATDTISANLLTRCADMARSQKIPLHMHLSQTAGERERTRQKEGVSPVVFAKECGALTEKTLAVHLVSADDSDLKILKDHGTTVGLCPASQIIYENLAPIAAFSRYRLPIALGTDCAASNDSSNILSELKLTALLCRHEKVQPEHLEPSNLLKMVTLNPARAFGLDHLIGSLAPGKMADLVMLKMSVDTQPMTNPITNLIFSMGAQHVEHVMINGQWSLWQGNLVRVSEQEIIKRSRDAWDEIKKRAGL